jgi:hypothetical protein
MQPIEGAEKKTGTAKVYTPSEVIPAGTWINSVYLEELKLTKSPHRSLKVFWDGRAGNTGYVNFVGDTFQSCHHLHEGAYRQVAKMIDSTHFEVYNQQNKALLFKGSFSKDYNKLTLEPVSVEGKTTELTFYPEKNFNESFNAMMVAGIYTEYDARGKELGEIEFEKDGTVNGVPGFKDYIFFYDFNGRGMNIDQMSFGTDRKNGKLYGWKLAGDTINLYNLKCTQKVKEAEPVGMFNCMYYADGELYRKLVRKR